jgi:hypothetical protein
MKQNPTRYDLANDSVYKKKTNLGKLARHHFQAHRGSAIPTTIKMVTRSGDSAVLNTATIFRRNWAI